MGRDNFFNQAVNRKLERDRRQAKFISYFFPAPRAQPGGVLAFQGIRLRERVDKTPVPRNEAALKMTISRTLIPLTPGYTLQ